MTALFQFPRFSLLLGLTILTFGCRKAEQPSEPKAATPPQIFSVTGIIKEIKPADHRVIIRHDEITNYMVAMTMPFTVRDTNELSGFSAGDRVSFSLMVTEEDSWIEQLTNTGRIAETTSPALTNAPIVLSNQVPLLDYKFTNELGRTVSFNDFKGRAVAFTFFFTRCPLPEYCPRLMKNFAGATEKLRTYPDAPTNWHFLAITFDPAFDTPTVLRDYAQRYRYDSSHWSFLTGDSNRIAELAQASGVYYEPDGTFFNHNFRTLVLDAAGQLQMSFPIGGDLSELLAEEILKAAAVPTR
jgi:protein SCO1/2